MRTQLKEPLIHQKELNKVLPSYLVDEIDEEQKEINHKHYKQKINFVLSKINKNVSI